MRVLFLDFDGVLHAKRVSGDEALSDKHLPFAYLPALQRVLQGHEVELVLVTSWAAVFPWIDMQEFLGLELSRRVIDVLDPQRERTQVIQEYVAEHRLTNWFALDDEIPPDWPGCCHSALGIYTPGVLGRLEVWLGTSS